MQERQVTIGEETFPLPSPFLVLATQNPIDQEGTYALPEAQVDRFMLKVIIDYPSRSEEQMIIRQNVLGLQQPRINAVVSSQEVLNARQLVRQVYMDEKVEQYILDIVFATRYPEKYNLQKLKPLISFGGSPRASINLALASKTYAYLNKRGYVIPEDVRNICKDVLRHRIGLTYEAEAENVNVEMIITDILKAVNVP
jgi:MoxR-like ATPase